MIQCKPANGNQVKKVGFQLADLNYSSTVTFDTCKLGFVLKSIRMGYTLKSLNSESYLGSVKCCFPLI